MALRFAGVFCSTAAAPQDMKRHFNPVLRRLSVLLVVLAGVGATPTFAQPVEALDARGATLRLAQPAQRIVTLAPNLTELAYAAGAGERLAGVARFSDYPPVARRLPVVGDAIHVDLERMLALRTDLVLAWQGGTPPDTVARIERAGLPVFVAAARELDDISGNIAAIAQLAGTQGAGAAARAAFDARLRDLRARRRTGPPIRVFYEIWGRPLMTVSDAHMISEIIRLCGGVNIFGRQPALTPEVSREALLAAHPELVLGGGSADTPAAFAARWAALPPPLHALPARYLPPDLIQRPTPRILDGADQVCAHMDAVRSARR